MTKLHLPIALASIGLLPMTSCLAVTKNETKYSGQRVTDSALDSVKLGMTADQVRSILGEPGTIVRGTDDSETWTYVAKRTEKKDSSVIFIIHSESTQEYEERVFVSFRSAQVVKAWRQTDK